MAERDTQHLGFVYGTGGENHRVTQHLTFVYTSGVLTASSTQHLTFVYATVQSAATGAAQQIPAFVGM